MVMSLIVGALSAANGMLAVFRAMDANAFSSVAKVKAFLSIKGPSSYTKDYQLLESYRETLAGQQGRQLGNRIQPRQSINFPAELNRRTQTNTFGNRKRTR